MSEEDSDSPCASTTSRSAPDTTTDLNSTITSGDQNGSIPEDRVMQHGCISTATGVRHQVGVKPPKITHVKVGLRPIQPPPMYKLVPERYTQHLLCPQAFLKHSYRSLNSQVSFSNSLSLNAA